MHMSDYQHDFHCYTHQNYYYFCCYILIQNEDYN